MTIKEYTESCLKFAEASKGWEKLDENSFYTTFDKSWEMSGDTGKIPRLYRAGAGHGAGLRRRGTEIHRANAFGTLEAGRLQQLRDQIKHQKIKSARKNLLPRRFFFHFVFRLCSIVSRETFLRFYFSFCSASACSASNRTAALAPMRSQPCARYASISSTVRMPPAALMRTFGPI